MAIKKSELYASLWKSCDELRGGMDASQYKDYVLVLLFMKYVSDKAASNPDYDLDVPPGASFADMVAAKGKPDIGERMNTIVAKLADANTELKGAMNVADFDDSDKLGKGKDKVDKLTNLIGIFESPSLNFRNNRADGDDLLGDAYEYLMRHFATESGKSKGQFYTPAEVSRILAKVVGVSGATKADQTIYDPTCGSGSLLLKAHDEARSATGLDLAIYGQEMDNATAALAKMNMVLHDAASAEIWQDNTLASPQFKDKLGGLKTFDFVVANPPFSTKSWSNGFNPAADDFNRFPYGSPPPKNGDFAFLLHILASLKSTGKAAVILPHGVLFRGQSEATIRRELIRRGFVKAIIGLPANLFYGTGIPACVVVLDKQGAPERAGIFMIDAGKGFIKDGPKNRLRAQDIHRIVDVFERQSDTPGYARNVSLAEVEANAFNLNLSRYVDSRPPEDVQDIDAHLRGGIPTRDIDDLSRYWNVFPTVRDALFESADRPGYAQVCVPAAEVEEAIFGHPEFGVFKTRVIATFDTWRAEAEGALASLAIGAQPKLLIQSLAEGLLATMANAPLIDPYDAYQRVMDYWSEALQDDAYLIAHAGWQEATRPRQITDVAGQKAKEVPDFLLGSLRFKSDLLPADLIKARFFADDVSAIDTMDLDVARLDQRLADVTEEHGIEGGLLEDAIGEGGKLNKPSIAQRLKEIAKDQTAGDERAILTECLSLIDEMAATRARAKAARRDLDIKVAACYGNLTEEETKSLVVREKWLARLSEDIQQELSRVSAGLTSRVSQLARRYEAPLPRLAEHVEVLTNNVNEHLRAMGATWS